MYVVCNSITDWPSSLSLFFMILRNMSARMGYVHHHGEDQYLCCRYWKGRTIQTSDFPVMLLKVVIASIRPHLDLCQFCSREHKMLSGSMGKIPNVYMFTLNGRRISNTNLREKRWGISGITLENNWKWRYSHILRHFSLKLPSEREKLFPSPVQILWTVALCKALQVSIRFFS